MRIRLLLITLACLTGCVAPSPPPQVSPPAVADINSDEFKEWYAAERRAELKKAAESKDSVTQSFYVGWEMHFGFFLIPVETPNPWFNPDAPRIFPDFLNEHVEAKFDAMNPTQTPKTVVCECTGVWFSDQRRFLVREAKLELRD